MSTLRRLPHRASITHRPPGAAPPSTALRARPCRGPVAPATTCEHGLVAPRVFCRLPSAPVPRLRRPPSASGSKHGSHAGGGAGWAAAAGWTPRRALEPACVAEGMTTAARALHARRAAAGTTAAWAWVRRRARPAAEDAAWPAAEDAALDGAGAGVRRRVRPVAEDAARVGARLTAAAAGP